jgi:hypothetical protein
MVSGFPFAPLGAGGSREQSTICGSEGVKDQSNVQAALYEWPMNGVGLGEASISFLDLLSGSGGHKYPHEGEERRARCLLPWRVTCEFAATLTVPRHT